MAIPQIPAPQPTYLSASSSYIWSLRSVCSHVMLASTTACSLISTNKFVPDTNYSFTVSGAVGSTNERQQSPHHRGLFVSTSSDRCVGRGRKTMDPLLAAGLKVEPSKEGKGGVKDMREEEWGRPEGISFCLYWGLKEVKRRLLHASQERRYVHVRICLPPAASAVLPSVPPFNSCLGLASYNQQQQELTISGCFSLLLCENSLHFLFKGSVCIGVSPCEMRVLSVHPEEQQWPVTMQVSKNGTVPLMSSYSQPSKHPLWRLTVAKCWHR